MKQEYLRIKAILLQATLDFQGNIHLILKPNKKETTKPTTQTLKFLEGSKIEARIYSG